jgi:hypothetical protein
LTKRRLAGVGLATSIFLLAIGAVALDWARQREDRAYAPRLARPAFAPGAPAAARRVAATASARPTVLVDEAHHNAHTATGRFAPFATLLRADGYHVVRGRRTFDAAALAGADIVVIANAAGGCKPQILGINLPFLARGERGAPAFSSAEIDALKAWVEAGGALLLIADHHPFGAAAAGLAAALGVRMHAGFTEVAGMYPGQTDTTQLIFARDNGLLAGHPIGLGRDDSERIGQVVTYTGQSLDGPDGSGLLLLPAGAMESIPGRDRFTEEPAGKAQCVAFELGRGRVIVAGEAAMLTAQVEKGHRFGMNVPGNDNQQFALNVMHWLSRLL